MILMLLAVMVLALGQTFLRYDSKYVKHANSWPFFPDRCSSRAAVILTLGVALAALGLLQIIFSFIF